MSEPPHAEEGLGAELSPHRREQLREGVTMALYMSLSLLAVLLASAVPASDALARELALQVFLIAAGLLLAHQVAFRLSTRLLSRGRLDAAARAALSAQLVAGFAVAVLAALPVLLLGGDPGLLVSELVLVALVALVGYAAARSVPVSRPRALLYVGGVVLVVVAVLVLKLVVGH